MTDTKRQHGRRSIIVVGCDDVGSAIACILHRAGAAVVVVDGADPPWSRRGMSYTDAWYVGGATLDGVDACFCGSVKSISPVLDRGDMVAATTWSWQGVAAVVCPAAVIETRQGRVALPAQCRPATLENVLAIGVRATHVGGWPADVVIADGFAPLDGARGGGRIADTALSRIEAPHGGRFRTRHEIAERVDAGDVIGELGGFAVVARVTGVLPALARVARASRRATCWPKSMAATNPRTVSASPPKRARSRIALPLPCAGLSSSRGRRSGPACCAAPAGNRRTCARHREPDTLDGFRLRGLAPFRMPVDYLQKILTAKVYDVAVETPLELAPTLSRAARQSRAAEARGPAAGVLVQAARRLQQDGAPDAGRARARRHRRVGRQSRAGRRARRAAARLRRDDRHAGHDAADQDRGGGGARRDRRAARRFVLGCVREGAASCRRRRGATFVHPYDDPDVIAGQGTIGMEILRQCQGPLDAIFVADRRRRADQRHRART